MRSLSAFAGGSKVCAAAREVLATDEVLRAFRGCRSELALAALAVARDEPDPPVEVNLTARWVEENYSRIYPMLVDHLTGKMPLSRDLSVIEDHVQTVLTRLVERDTLAPFLRDKKTVKLSVLRIWAYQSASTELRRWGVDASLRASRGAKTAREIQAGKAWRVVQSASPFREVVQEISQGTETVEEQYNPSAESPEDAVSRKSRVELVRDHLVRTGQGHLVCAVDHVLGGGSVSDLPGGVAEQLTAVLRGIQA